MYEQKNYEMCSEQLSMISAKTIQCNLTYHDSQFHSKGSDRIYNTPVDNFLPISAFSTHNITFRGH